VQQVGHTRTSSGFTSITFIIKATAKTTPVVVEKLSYLQRFGDDDIDTHISKRFQYKQFFCASSEQLVKTV
jgi:hypothetical protein